MTDNQPLLDVAAALADGTPVDWNSAAQSITSDDDRRLLAELQFIAKMALVRHAGSDSSSVLTSPLTSTHGSARIRPDSEPSVETWGPLTIIERVGRGSFGNVYRAWDTRLDREVAERSARGPRAGNADAAFHRAP